MSRPYGSIAELDGDFLGFMSVPWRNRRGCLNYGVGMSRIRAFSRSQEQTGRSVGLADVVKDGVGVQVAAAQGVHHCGP